MQCQGRAGPNAEQLVRDLEALLSGQPAVAAAPAASPRAAAPAAAAAADMKADNDLDMTK